MCGFLLCGCEICNVTFSRPSFIFDINCCACKQHSVLHSRSSCQIYELIFYSFVVLMQLFRCVNNCFHALFNVPSTLWLTIDASLLKCKLTHTYCILLCHTTVLTYRTLSKDALLINYAKPGRSRGALYFHNMCIIVVLPSLLVRVVVVIRAITLFSRIGLRRPLFALSLCQSSSDGLSLSSRGFYSSFYPAEQRLFPASVPHLVSA